MGLNNIKRNKSQQEFHFLAEVLHLKQNTTMKTFLSYLIDKAYPDVCVSASKRSVFNCIILTLPPPTTTKETQ